MLRLRVVMARVVTVMGIVVVVVLAWGEITGLVRVIRYWLGTG